MHDYDKKIFHYNLNLYLRHILSKFFDLNVFIFKLTKMKKTLILTFGLFMLTACGEKITPEKTIKDVTSQIEITTPEIITENMDDKISVEVLEIEKKTPTEQTPEPPKKENISKTNPQSKMITMHTTMGDIKIKMFPAEAPKTVENFIGLAKKGKYNNTIFHRIIDGFMIQGGDYENFNGTGGASLWGKDFEDEPSPKLSNVRGTISMANRGQNTNGSQFFINQKDNINLDGYANGKLKNCAHPMVSCHTVFGQVVEGIDVVDKIAKSKKDYNDKPLKDIKIKSITVE